MLHAFQSNVVGRKRFSRRCCAVEGWLPLHVVWIGPCFPPSTGFRSQNVDSASEYDVIWARLRLWCLDAGLAAALLNCVLSLVRRLHWLLLLRCLSRLDKIPWLSNYCSPLHWGQILDRIRFKGPKKCWRSCCVHNEFVIARPCDHRPSVSRGMITSRAFGREKWDFPCFPNFI